MSRINWRGIVIGVLCVVVGLRIAAGMFGTIEKATESSVNDRVDTSFDVCRSSIDAEQSSIWSEALASQTGHCLG